MSEERVVSYRGRRLEEMKKAELIDVIVELAERLDRARQETLDANLAWMSAVRDARVSS